MKRIIERNTPPGYSYITELVIGGLALLAGTLSSFARFTGTYLTERQALYAHRGAERILDESAIMPDFVHIVGDKLNLLLLGAVLIFIGASIAHYASYYAGSKSIYLMRRLPNRFELYRRCFVLPLLYALAFLLAAALLLLLYYALYMSLTPDVCLAPNQWQKLWGIFL